MIEIPLYLHGSEGSAEEDYGSIVDIFGRVIGNDIKLKRLSCLCDSHCTVEDYPVAIFQGERGCRIDCYQIARQRIMENPNTTFFNLGINFDTNDTGEGFMLLAEPIPSNYRVATMSNLAERMAAIERLARILK